MGEASEVVERISGRASTPARTPLGQGFRTPRSHLVAENAIRVVAFAAILAIVLIFAIIAREALPLFFDAEAQEELGGLDALLFARAWPGYPEARHIWQPVGDVPKFDVVPLLAGTVKVTLLAMLIATPVAFLSAIYVSQYAGKRVRELLKPAIELLASVPSVVLGFLSLVVLASAVQALFGTTYRLNAFVAAIGLSLAIVPLVFTIAEDALRSVPRELVNGALALGARKHQVILRVVLPAAMPGLAAATVLGLGRALGETMIVLMASGNAAVVELFDPTSSARTITATLASELGEVSPGDAHWRVLFLLGTVLFLFTFVLNRAGAVIIERLGKRLRAEAT
jgi:phosphate transport system permease protein